MNEHSQRLENLYLEIEPLIRADRRIETIPFLEQLLSLQPDWEHGNGWYDLSLACEEKGDKEKALECAARAMLYQPDGFIFELRYIDLASQYGDADHAFEVLEVMLAGNCSIYTDLNGRYDQILIVKLIQQVLSRTSLNREIVKVRLDKACPAAKNLWRDLQ